MPVRISPVDSAHNIWPIVEQALDRVRHKTGEKWTPDYVLSQVQQGKAGLFRIHGDAIGWMVVERIDQGNGVWMNVWVIEGDGLKHADELIPQIDSLARAIGADSWRCTGRHGWGRALRNLLKPRATVYERVL